MKYLYFLILISVLFSCEKEPSSFYFYCKVNGEKITLNGGYYNGNKIKAEIENDSVLYFNVYPNDDADDILAAFGIDLLKKGTGEYSLNDYTANAQVNT